MSKPLEISTVITSISHVGNIQTFKEGNNVFKVTELRSERRKSRARVESPATVMYTLAAKTHTQEYKQRTIINSH